MPKTKPKKPDNFFDDPVDNKQNHKARPDLLKSRPGEIEAPDERKPREKNFFDDEFEDTQVPPKEVVSKPNFTKNRVGSNVATTFNVRSSTKPREETQKDLYADFEVHLDHQDDFEDVKAGVQIKFTENNNDQQADYGIMDQSLIYQQMNKVFAVKQLIKFEVESNEVFEISTASRICSPSFFRSISQQAH